MWHVLFSPCYLLVLEKMVKISIIWVQTNSDYHLLNFMLRCILILGHRYFTNPRPLNKLPENEVEKDETAGQDTKCDSNHRTETNRTQNDSATM